MLKDDQIAGIVLGRIQRANNFIDTGLSRERIEISEAMQGLTPKPHHKGSAKYVSSDVFEAVEGMSAQLVETFCGSYQTVKFLPNSAQDVEEARIATELVNHAVHVQNPGFKIFSDVIYDALTSRLGVVKMSWEKSEEEYEETFEGDPMEMASYMGANPSAEPGDDATIDETGQMSVTFKTTTDTSQLKISVLPPEEFIYSGRSRSFQDAELLAHRTQKTAGELIAMGFDKKTVEELQDGADWMYHSSEVLSRTRMEDPMSRLDRDDEAAGREISVVECYTKLDLTGKGKPRKLYQIMMAGNTILSKQEVKRIPFFGFIPLARPHTIMGESFAGRVIPTQSARTALMRSIVDHAAITTNPRYMVLRNGLMDPRELLENRLGGVVNLNKPDAVATLPQAPLNPFVYQTIAMLDSDREGLTGVSKLSQGLNKDALSQQNSGAMVEQLVSLSQIRQKVVARRFGEFLKELYVVALAIITENASKQFSLEVAGNWVQVDPSLLKLREQVSLDLSLGLGEREKEAQKYIMMNQVLSANPALARMYGEQQKYNVLSRALVATGVKDVSTILVDPKSLPPPQPTPQQQVQMAKEQAEVALLQAEAQAKTAEIQMNAQRFAAEHQLKMLKLQAEIEQTRQSQALAGRKQDFKETLDTAEFRLAAEEVATQAKVQTLIQPPKI